MLLFWRRLLEHGGSRGPDEHAMTGLATKVALSLHSSIVLPRSIVQLDPEPIASGEMGLACELNFCCPAILELDGLTNLEI